MVGQYPHGIDLHVRNLKWALSEEDKIFIVTVPSIIETFNLRDDDRVQYIPFDHKETGSYINFWAKFPAILNKLNIDPDMFLFMESDIWFHHKPACTLEGESEILNYLPLQNWYHAITVGGSVVHPRVWEGGTLVSCGVVRRAIEFGVSFSAVKTTFCDKDKSWEEKAGGPIGFNFFSAPDTFDEFGLYCTFVEQTTMRYIDHCAHIRGPETLHRKYPALYNDCTESDLAEARKRLPYICVLGAVAAYFIDGHWQGDLDWSLIDPKFKAEFSKLRVSAPEWMTPDEYVRLKTVIDSF